MQDVLKRVGRFDLLEVIGRGGAAVVYLAMQRDLQRHVALKELAPFHLADTSFAERFVEESRLAGSMNHANIVTVHEFFEDGSVRDRGSSTLPHGSLRQYIGRLSTAQIAGVLEGVLAGLAHGEAHQIVHRDLEAREPSSPSTAGSRSPDFGVARAYSKAATRAVVTVAGRRSAPRRTCHPSRRSALISPGHGPVLAGRRGLGAPDRPGSVRRHRHPGGGAVSPCPRAGALGALGGARRRRGHRGVAGRDAGQAPEDRFQSADEAWVALEDLVLDLLGPRCAARPASHSTTRPRAPVAPSPPPPSTRSRSTPRRRRPASGGRPGSVGRTPVPQTISGPDAAGPHHRRSAPARRRERSHTTMFRLARRHRDIGEDDTPLPPDVMRRRLIARRGWVAAMAAPAVAGWCWPPWHANPSRADEGPDAVRRSSVPPRRSKAAATAAANEPDRRHPHEPGADAQPQPHPPASTTARRRSRSVMPSRSRRPTSPRCTRSRRSSQQTTSAAPLATTMTEIADVYGRLISAGRANKPATWTRRLRHDRGDEATLQGEVARLAP